MNRLDREILKAILTEEQSIYSVNEVLKQKGEESNYATVWRHIKKMREDGLLAVIKARRKNGKPDKRETQLLSITEKGIATLLLKAGLTKKELMEIGSKSWEDTISKLPPNERFLTKELLAEVFAESLIEIRPKVNLEFFDRKWFREIWLDANLKTVKKAFEKHKAEFEAKAMWVTEEEIHDNIEQLMKDLLEGGNLLEV